jgi:hypothetical protein
VLTSAAPRRVVKEGIGLGVSLVFIQRQDMERIGERVSRPRRLRPRRLWPSRLTKQIVGDKSEKMQGRRLKNRVRRFTKLPHLGQEKPQQKLKKMI